MGKNKCEICGKPTFLKHCPKCREQWGKDTGYRPHKKGTGKPKRKEHRDEDN